MGGCWVKYSAIHNSAANLEELIFIYISSSHIVSYIIYISLYILLCSIYGLVFICIVFMAFFFSNLIHSETRLQHIRNRGAR